MGTNVKLSCSFKWLFRILSEHYSLEDLEERKLMQKGAIQHLLLEPYNKGRLKKQTVDLLSDASLYWSAYLAIYPGGRVEKENFECLIHNLAKNGGYVLENDDVIVNGSMLAQKAPFRETSHLALLDVLMVQYAAKIVTVRRTVQAARKILSFNPSQELPSKPDVEQLLMIWLNKVAQAVEGEHHARRRRRNKRVKGIPAITGDLCSALKDGRHLALLLLYYAPESFSWHDFNLDDGFQAEHYLSNIQAVYEYCNVRYAPYTFHVSPVDFWQWAESGLLRCNIIACLAHLFHSLEIAPSTSTMRVPPISRHISTHTNILQSASDSMVTRKKRKEWLDSSGNGAPRKRLDHSLTSKPASSNVLKCTLPEVKPSQLQRGQTVDDTMSNSFMAPIRSSQNLLQTSILSKFKREQEISTQLRHSRSFPLTGTQQQPSSMENTSTSSAIILAPINMDKVDTSDGYRSGDESHFRSEAKAAQSDKQDSLRLDNVGSKDNLEELESDSASSSGSFTVHKRHTFSSAAAAGLPVVDGKFSCSSEKRTVFQEPKDEHSESDDRKNTILLTNFLELRHNSSLETVEPEVELTVPPSVQRLKEKLIPVLASFHSDDAEVEARVTAVVGRVCSNWACERTNSTNRILRTLKHLSVDDTMGSVNTNTGEIIVENCGSNGVKRIAAGSGGSDDISGIPAEDHGSNGVKIISDNGGSIGVKGIVADSGGSTSIKEINGEDSSSNGVKKIAADSGNSNGITGITVENCGANGAYADAMKRDKSNNASMEHLNTMTSLEQFERDEVLACQQATPSLSDQSETKPAVASGTPYCSNDTKPFQLIQASESCCDGGGVTCHGSACAFGSNDVAGISRSTSNQVALHPEETAAASNVAVQSIQESQVVLGESRSTKLRGNKIPFSRNTCDVTSSAVRYGFNGDSRHSAGTESGENNPAVIEGGGNSVPKIVQLHKPLPTADYRTMDGGSVGNSVAVPNDAAVRPSNPWVSPLHQDTATPLQKRKEKKLKQLLDERDRARKSAAERRKKEKQLAGNGNGKLHNSSHLTLSSVPSEEVQQDAPPVVTDIAHLLEKRSASYLEYSGPNCYTKPKAKTNLPIVRNAICTVCLAGEVNNPIKESVIKALEQTTATHALILFRDRVGFKFRGIYSYYPGERFILRICGTGPKEIKDTMISALYKYNSGQRDFKEIPSHSFSVSVDGLTIKSECWHNAKRKSSAKNNHRF